MELTQGSETSANYNYNMTPGKYPKEHIQYSEHGESLKSTIHHLYGEDIALHIRRLEKLRIKKTTLLSSLTFLLRCRDHNIIPRFLQIHHHIRSRAANRIYLRTSFALLRERIHQNRRELASTSRILLDTHLRLANTLTASHWCFIDQLTSNKAAYVGDGHKIRQSQKFARLTKNQLPATGTLKNTVINLSNKKLDDGTFSLLQKGLNYAVAPQAPPIEEILVGIEKAVRSLPVEQAEEARQETVRIIKTTTRTKNNLTKNERTALKTLKDNTELTILPADKGNATVILNTTDYKLKIASLLGDSAYKKLDKDPTDSIERKTIKLLKKSSLPEDLRKQLQPSGSRAPRLYGLPKIHKEGVPLRPIVSNIGAPTYQLAKQLTGFLNQLTGNSSHHVKNSFHFTQILDKLQVQPGDLMVSFDVVSLFTKVPVDDSLSLLSHHFTDDILELFKLVLTSTYFCFNYQYFEQTDGVAMGSPLSPVIANFFMEDFEERALNQATLKPTCWYRYVDDIFAIWPHGEASLISWITSTVYTITSSSPWK
jgi:hypothetical protein